MPSLDNTSSRTAVSVTEDPGSIYEPSMNGHGLDRMTSHMGTATVAGDDEDEDDYGDDTSSHEMKPQSKDAFNITAQSAKLQLDLLTSVSGALQAEMSRSPDLKISDPMMLQAFTSYESAIGNLKGLIGDLLRISRDRDAYWQYRLDREANVRRMWEESMAKVAKEQEELENRIGESEEKRRKQKKALREALEDYETTEPKPDAKDEEDDFADAPEDAQQQKELGSGVGLPVKNQKVRRKATFADIAADISDSESEDDEEFFDAVGAGEVEVVEMPAAAPKETAQVDVPASSDDPFEKKHMEIATAWAGYEDGPRKRLAMDADDRPKISLWVCLISQYIYQTLTAPRAFSSL